MAENVTLESFEISRTTGFLPETHPLCKLPPGFNEWNEVARQLSDLLRTGEFRNAVDRLPKFNCELLSTDAEWRAALVLLSGIFQGYMWQNGEKGVPNKMPSIISVPFHRVCEKIGTPLVGTYASTVLYNWRLTDPERGITMENLEAIVNHTGTKDESWFFMIHVLIEHEAVPAIEAIWKGLPAMEERNNDALVQCLTKIESALTKMKHILTRMAEGCEPKVFYVDIRPFLAGTKGLDVFPNGMIYEGVFNGEARQFNGGSAAQSTPLKAMDIFLGVQHDPHELEFLEDMKTYMPAKHRGFLEFLSKHSSLREYIVNSHDQKLAMQFNSTIEALVSFRNQHIITVTRYIVNQKQHTINPSLENRGTGGTPFMDFLKQVRDDTLETKIQL